MALMESFFSVMNQLSKNSVFLKEITCSVCSSDGEQICKTFRLDYVRDNVIGRVYSGPVGSVIKRFQGPLATRCPGLLERYENAGLC